MTLYLRFYCLELLKDFVKICKFFQYLSFSLTTVTGQQIFSSLADGFLDRTFETKNGFEFFYCEVEKFSLILRFSVIFYMIYLLTRLKKLEVAVSIPIMEDIPVSFSLFRLGSLSFSFSFTFYLSLSLSLPHTLSLSLSLCLCRTPAAVM